jgi:hypothetical protein
VRFTPRWLISTEKEILMSKPANHTQPDVSRFSSRTMAIPPKRMEFEILLLDWMQVVVSNTDNPPNK